LSGFRTDSGGLINRDRRLNFTFDGKTYQGFEGDTLASALMANGVRVLGRSFKYHRARGVWGAWVDEPNAIMNVSLNGKEIPNCLATTTQLKDGMQACAVNAWPSANVDIKAGLGLFHRWLGAGFYYKTFIWPNWHWFEPAIRKMAGLGAVSTDVFDDYSSDQQHDHCDTLIVGAGAAGLSAARAASETGQHVVLVDDHSVLGGSLFQQSSVEGKPPGDWVEEQLSAIKIAGGRVLKATTAFGVFDHKLVGLIEHRDFGFAPKLLRMRAGHIILASGALDRPITFANNDKPGVMSLMGAAEYLARYGVLCGKSLAVLSNHNLAEAAQHQLAAAGASVNAIDASLSPIKVVGRKSATGVKVAGQMHHADTVLVSGGLTPLVHLWSHAGGKLDWCETRQAFLPGKAPEGFSAIGAANGTFDLDLAIDEARAVGANPSNPRSMMSLKTGTQIPSRNESPHKDKTSYKLTPLWPKPGSIGRQWIDFQHDVTLKDVENAARENYVSVEHLKRYTTLGMASDQGKTSNMAGLAAMATLQGRPIPELGTTTFRPPFIPIPIEAYHGNRSKQRYSPLKRLPLEPNHRELNAALCEYGGWLRPGWYGDGESENHIQAEASLARKSAGIFDASPLGKIEVMGPDAEAFLNFVYYTTIAKLEPGNIRYGFMLSEGGIVFDDGVITRVDRHRFIVSCSSSHVDAVRAHLESWRQDGNNPEHIFIHDQTMQWATITVTGPSARDIVGDLHLDVDLSPMAFPHMTFRETEFNDSPIRLSRVSFTGDVSYELSIKASRAVELWNALMAAGKVVNAGPIGIEAVSILRAEKGYLMVGKDTDGETMPHDLGFGLPRINKTHRFVGDRSLHSETASKEDRKSLVGLCVEPGEKPLATGAHAISGAERTRSIGYVTSSYFSPHLMQAIALALIERGNERVGETVEIWHREERRQATICSASFYDPKGVKLHA